MLPYKVYRDGREECLDTLAGRREYRGRTLAMRDRQGELCLWCGRWMLESMTTFDHEFGRNAGRRDDRLYVEGKPINAALHLICNGIKGSRKVPYPFECFRIYSRVE